MIWYVCASNVSVIRLTKGELTYRSDFLDVFREVLGKHNFDVRDEIRITLIGTEQEILIPDLLVLEREILGLDIFRVKR